MAYFKTRAFVVRATPLKNDDLRVVLLTKDHGKVVGFAPAAKKSRRRFGAALETLTLVSALFSRKPNQSFVRLQEAQVIDPLTPLKKDITKIAYGSYFLELISEVMQEKEAPEKDMNDDLFHYLASFLKALEATQSEALLARLFEARLLPKIGWQPVLMECLQCRKELDQLRGQLLFLFFSGGVLCSLCQQDSSMKQNDIGKRVSKEAIVYLNQMMSGEKNLKRDLVLGSEIKRFLPPFLFHQLGKALKSYGFIEKVVS